MHILCPMVGFFEHPFFMVAGGVFTSISLLGILYLIYLAGKGIIPVWWRLGIALSRNKISIFAKDDIYNDLEKVLTDSKLFKSKNIRQVTGKNIRSAEKSDLLLMYWPDFQDKLDEILHIKSHSVGLVVYAPQENGRIADESMTKLNAHHNVTITNFRGRLLNDVFVSMITTKRAK